VNFPAAWRARRPGALVPPSKDQRKTMPAALQVFVAKWRNRIEASLGEITDLMELTRHGARPTGACSPGPQRPTA
jgi:hypothetical protein